jgi:hypothetical protein
MQLADDESSHDIGLSPGEFFPFLRSCSHGRGRGTYLCYDSSNLIIGTQPPITHFGTPSLLEKRPDHYTVHDESLAN